LKIAEKHTIKLLNPIVLSNILRCVDFKMPFWRTARCTTTVG